MVNEWKEGAIVMFSDVGEEPREMRVTRVRRTGPSTTDVTLEAVSGPSELRCTCPYTYVQGRLSGIGTSRTCEMHGENREKLERLRAARQKA